jgi:hypothetical protein
VMLPEAQTTSIISRRISLGALIIVC